VDKREIAVASESEVLARLASDPSPAECRRLSHRLWEVATEASLDALPSLLRSPDRNVRARSDLMLRRRRFSSEQVAGILVEALDSSYSDVVEGAAYSLAKRGIRSAVPELVRRLEADDGTLAPSAVTMLVKALSDLPHRLSIPVLASQLRSPRSSAKTRRWAAVGLARIRAPESRAALQSAAADMGWWRGRHARRALRRYPEADQT